MATGRHTISHAKNLFSGDAQYTLAHSGQRGVPFTPIYHHNYGTAITTSNDDGLVTKQVLSTAAATYVLGSSVVGVVLAGTEKTLDHPRNVKITTSDLADLATLTVVGRDQYGATMWERILVTASDAAVSGKKAFKVISSIRSVGTNGPSGTFYVGWGSRIGLPYRLRAVGDVLHVHSGTTNSFTSNWTATDFVLPTHTATEIASASAEGSATDASGLTRDVRGTFKPPALANANALITITYVINDVDTKIGTYGIDQAAS